MKLDGHYYQKLYAGILGKVIGVYVGRPFEGWVNEDIVAKFGEINRYVNKQVNHPLICSDDDITGTFMFTHALEEHLFREDFSAKHLGQSWLDNLIEGKTVLWWGGYGQSTEHTAWLNLRNGIEAPKSGAIETNGKTVSEQIGAQIFIDGWAMINPALPQKAAYFAREAARVSHDGEAVNAAVLLAVMEAQAFIEKDLNTLLDLGLKYIPQDSDVARVVCDVRQWHNENPTDWNWAFAQLKEHYGYDKFNGTCHVIPNHGLIILSLLYGGDSFHESIKIVNTLGWDTDCNAANVGCLNGIRLGLKALDDGYDWRGPIADRILLPTASAQDHIFDALQEADKLMAIATYLHTGNQLPRRSRFHFSLPGAVQGFQCDLGVNNLQSVSIDNPNSALEVKFRNLVKGVPARFKTPTHTDINCKVNETSYHVVGSPSLYPQQTVTASVELACGSDHSVEVALFIEVFDTELNVTSMVSPATKVLTNQTEAITWVIPDVGNKLIASIGFEVTSTQSRAQAGTVRIHELDWTGTPTLSIGIDEKPIHEVWESSFINTMDTKIKFNNQAIYRLVNNNAEQPGIYVFGNKEWRDYVLSIKLTPQIKRSFGPVIRYQGLSRYYRFQLTSDDQLQLIHCHYDKITVIAQSDFPWQPHTAYHFNVEVKGNHFICCINKNVVISISDDNMPVTFLSGAAGFYNQLGAVHYTKMTITAV